MANKPPKGKDQKSFLQYVTMSTQMLVTIIAFLLLGRFLDSKVEVQFPIFTLIFILLGVFGSMYQFIRKL